jgi:hypothetical protein
VLMVPCRRLAATTIALSTTELFLCYEEY